MVSFNQIPSNLRVPFLAVEIDGSNAQRGPSALAYRAILIGQKIAAGTAAANTLHRVTSADEVLGLAGRGSQLHRMARAWFKANQTTELWIGVLEDDGSAVAAAATLTFTGPATKAGTLSLYIGGELVRVAVALNDTAAQVATKVVAAIPSSSDLAVTAAVGGVGSEHIVTLTAKNGGAEGNEIDLRLNYVDDEVLPAGVGCTVVAFATGATNPVLTGLIAALGDMWFHIIAHPYTDSTSLAALETELASRNGPLRMIDGVAITAKRETVANLVTFGSGRNSQFTVVLPLTKLPSAPAELAAAAAGVVAYYGAIDPARPMTTLEVTGIKPPSEPDQMKFTDRNLLLQNGIATLRVGPGNLLQIDRLVTTYQKNAAGSPDTAFLDLATMLTLMYARYNFRTRWATRYPRHKLGRDGVRYPAGEAVMTPSLGRAEAVAWYQDMSLESPVVFDPSGLQQFKRDLVVEINSSDPNRLDFLLPPDLINQLIVTAARISFLS